MSKLMRPVLIFGIATTMVCYVRYDIQHGIAAGWSPWVWMLSGIDYLWQPVMLTILAWGPRE